MKIGWGRVARRPIAYYYYYYAHYICIFSTHTRAFAIFIFLLFSFFGGAADTYSYMDGNTVADRTIRCLQVGEHLNWLSSNIDYV